MKAFKHNAVKVKNPNTGNFEELPSFGGGSSASTDKTLSISGQAADAKEVGDRLSKLPLESRKALFFVWKSEQDRKVFLTQQFNF